MGDSFWMEDEVRVEWKKATSDRWRLFLEPDRSASMNPLSLLNAQIEEYIFQKAQYPASNTGSQYLDPLWRRSSIKINFKPTRFQGLLSLN